MKTFDYSLLAKRTLALLCICLLAAAALVPLLDKSSSACTSRQPGVTDLSACTFDDNSVFPLNGQWEFHWQQLLEAQGSRTAAAELPAYMAVPGSWGPKSAVTGYSRYGYATYRMLVQLPPDIPVYALKVTNIRNASRVFVNGELLGSSGTPGTSSESTIPRNNPYSFTFSAKDNQAEILIHTSNFIYTNGGISEPLLIGTPSAIGALNQRNSTYDILLTAGFAFIGLYLFGQGFQRKDDKASLQLALYCFTIALYMLTHSEKLLLGYLPSLSYEGFSKLQMISGLVGFYFVSSYTYSLFPALYSRIFRRITFVYSAGFCLITLTTTMRVYSRVSGILLFFSLISVIYTFYVMAKATWRRETGSYYLLIGVIAAIMFTLTLTSNLVLGTGFYSVPPVSGPIFIIAEGLFLSARHAHAYQTIKQLSRQLERKDRDKDEFLLKTSTQLRTPLNAIINIALSMYEGAGGPLSSSQREDMRLILGTGRRLAFLVRDILDYEQIKRQRITLHWGTIDIQGVAGIVIEVFQFLNKKGEIRIKNHIPPGTFLVEADEQRLMQILYNLLDNALKFTDRGSVVIEAVQQDGLVSVSVTDTGRGIPEDQLESIFRDYEQISEADSLETGGLGLSLAISRKLVELHGGTISVTSGLGRGSTFTFTLPFKQAEAAGIDEAETPPLHSLQQLQPEMLDDAWKYRSVAPPQSAGTAGLYAPRILIVDDDYANLKALTNLLSLEKYTISSRRSGKDALALLAEDRNFDLCIIDVMMPEMSGLELCRLIRQTYTPLDLPILMATAGQQLHFNEAAFRAGANDFIHKPYAWSDLKGRVNTLVQLRRSVSDRLSSEIAMLRAQIKPHFLYNAINTIIWMSARDNEKTRHLLYDLSHFLRGSFDFSNQETAIPFEKELELIEAYLSLEQARFGKRLNVQYNIEASEFSLPPLIVQPIVENAVRHGLMEKIGGGTVTLSTRQESDAILITVSDNGKGMSDEQLASWMQEDYRSPHGESTGIGLRNINRRLLTQFGYPLILTHGAGGGVDVLITIPWKDEVN
ncbi:ATP-binding protein [Paenibacillus sp. MMS20-IR301]|uniref:ATP-binding protein n=1 Tax=Paenibacillus sp. MMS20-IR301 TaxID=2895946 RepID=UPI0028E3B9D6|nr:ATP-binding protein [Paenibacillus sp. MMS20-IR301]WNS42527.1 ATP-binding protein [Paenibacillus sp. MMS20-IR301]